MRENIRKLVAYTLALVVVTTLIVKVLDLPTILSGAPALVEEYYGPWWSAMAFDWVLIAIYIWVGNLIANKHRLTFLEGTIVATFSISGAFCLYFLIAPRTNHFFSRWFHKAKGWAVVYDILLVGGVAWMYQYLEEHLEP